MKSKISSFQEELKTHKIKFIHNIQLVVSSVFNITIEELKEKDRCVNKSIPRAVSVYICHLFLPSADYELICKQHNLNRTSVYHCVKLCKIIIEYKDKTMYKELYEKLEESILRSLYFVKIFINTNQKINLKKVLFLNKVLKTLIENEKK